MSKIKAVFFDLDGTLLPMDQDAFLKGYMGLLAKYMAEHGFDPQYFLRALQKGTGAMMKNDGSRRNEVRFWEVFSAIYAADGIEKPDISLFDAFYAVQFPKTRDFCGFDARPRRVVDLVKKKGLTPVLATMPAFPAVATNTRMGYVDLVPADFAAVTSYENSSFCKPTAGYYKELLQRTGFSPAEVLMVGNDMSDDMIPATALGMDTFLLTEYLLNPTGADISVYRRGGYDDLLVYLEEI